MAHETIALKITNRHGLKIAVLVEIPEQPSGLVFVAHGFTGCKEETHIIATAETALATNLICVRYDATHSFGDSDGDVQYSTVQTYVDDLADVIAWAATQEWYQEPYILLGYSFGGMSCLEYTRAHIDKVKALAPIGSFISGAFFHAAHLKRDPVVYASWQKTGWCKRQSPVYPERTGRLPWSHMKNRLLYNAL